MIEFGGKLYYTAQEFADKYKVTKGWICKKIVRGELPAVDVGVQYLLPVDEADEAWARRNRRTGRR